MWNAISKAVFLAPSVIPELNEISEAKFMTPTSTSGESGCTTLQLSGKVVHPVARVSALVETDHGCFPKY